MRAIELETYETQYTQRRLRELMAELAPPNAQSLTAAAGTNKGAITTDDPAASGTTERVAAGKGTQANDASTGGVAADAAFLARIVAQAGRLQDLAVGHSAFTGDLIATWYLIVTLCTLVVLPSQSLHSFVAKQTLNHCLAARCHALCVASASELPHLCHTLACLVTVLASNGEDGRAIAAVVVNAAQTALSAAMQEHHFVRIKLLVRLVAFAPSASQQCCVLTVCHSLPPCVAIIVCSFDS